MTRALDLASLPNTSDGAVLLPIRPPAPNIGDVLTVQSLNGPNVNLFFQPMQAAASGALPILGGTMLGPLVLARDPTVAMEAATRQYVDTKVSTIYNPRGGYNAATNTPTLGNGGAGGVKGDVFTTTTAGTAAFDGVGALAVGDQLQNTGTQWVKVAYSTAFGSLAFVNATAVGALAGLTSLTFTDTSFLGLGNPMMPDLAWWRRDAAGNIVQALDWDGVSRFQALQVMGATTLATLSVAAAVTFTALTSPIINATQLIFPDSSIFDMGTPTMPDLVRWWRDASGNIPIGLGTDGTFIVNKLQVIASASMPATGTGDDPNSFSPSLIDARDARATANSMAVRGQTNSAIAQPIWTHSMVLIYGQSLSVGNQGLPRMSTDEGLDNLTLGLAPGGTQTATDYVFIPDTNSNINQLDGTRGYETPGISATNQWRHLQLQFRDLASDPTRRLIVNGCGEGGKSIEELSKGFATPCYYDRIPSLLNQVKAAILAANPSNTFGVTAVYYLQGEANYSPTWDTSTAGYQAKWDQLRTDITADIKSITGQKLAPAFFASQPNSEWDNTLHLNTIAMAFLNAGTTPPLGDYLTMPNYQVPNSNPNGPHMSPDGYRQMGNQVGHIMHRVLDKGEGWLPLYPTRITYRGKQLLLECHTPEPPLQVQPFYSGADGSTIQPILSDYGFSCGDSLGALTITSIVLYNSVILINVNRNVATGAWVDYANKLHDGNGNICDSDPFISLDIFKTLPTSKLGQPYPGNNWMVAFRINATSDIA